MKIKMKKIVIFGSGGFAREVKFLIEEIDNIKIKYNFSEACCN